MNDAESQLVARVRGFARGPFAERAERNDREGRFPAENIAELKALHVPGLSIQPQYGGLGMSSEARVRVMEEIAYGDGSTAVAMNMHLLVLDLLMLAPVASPDVAALFRDVAENGALICGPGSIAMGQLDTRGAGFTAVDDGPDIVINGRGGFASMSDGAAYVFLGGNVARGEGVPPDLFFCSPRMDSPGVTNAHNWDAMGLRGTASNDIVAENVRVPKAAALILPRAFFAMVQQAAALVPPVIRQNRAAGALGITGLWLGLAQAALDATVEYVKGRYGFLPVALPGTEGIGLRSEQGWAQGRIGEMANYVHSGRILLYDLVARLDTPFATPEAFTTHVGHTLYYLRRMTEEVAMGAMKTCGAHAYVKGNPLERIYRDLTGCYVMAWKTDQAQQELGKAALGFPGVSFAGPLGA